MKTLKPVLFVIIVFSLISVACLASGTANDNSTTTNGNEVSEEVVVEEPVQDPKPTEEIVVEEPEVEEPAGNEPQPFYVEEFDDDLENWTYFLMSGNEDLMDLYTEDGYLVFDLEGEQQYVYVMYDPFTYENVMVEVKTENRGANTNNVSLVCNYTDKYGWYEFSISNGGLYYIYVYSELDGGYDILANGGSKNVITGRHENVYTATCNGNELALYVNGVLEYEMTDNLYNLTEGQVGFGVSSFDVLPIIIYADYVAISQ